MRLTTDYLYLRYEYWKERIGEREIWDPALFGKVDLVIRPASKNYNGMFIRRWKVKEGQKEVYDRIFIYDKTEEHEPVFVDSVLVHEMIHQYIIQNNLKDTRTHGRIFREFMKKINAGFPEELDIRISARNPALPLKGQGDTLHYLLFLRQKKGFFSRSKNDYLLWCVINPSRLDYFNELLKKNRKFWKISEFNWGVSQDIYFNSFRRCTRALRGIQISPSELPDFLKTYSVKPLKT